MPVENSSFPATGTKHTLKPLQSLDCRGFLVNIQSFVVTFVVTPQDYICALTTVLISPTATL